MKLRGWFAGLLVCVLTSCGTQTTKHPVAVPSADYTATALQWADSITATLSPRQLAAQMVMPAMYARCDEQSMHLVQLYADSLQVGGVMMLKGDVQSVCTLVDSMTTLSPIAPFIAIDAEWGLAMRLPEAPDYPLNGNLPDSVADQLLYDYGYEVAREARILGVNVVLGPVLDVAGPGSVIGKRSYGTDPVRVADLGVAYARGLEAGNVMSVAKHFPGLGSAGVDSHRTQPLIRRSAGMLDSTDLLPFRRYVQQGLSGVMVGHLAVPAFDTVVRSAAVSPMIITDLLRQKLGFRGLVFTDALNMGGLGRVEHPAVRAILAGADIVLAPRNTIRTVDEITQAIMDGRIPETVATNVVRRILFYKYCLTAPDVSRPPLSTLHSPESNALLRALTP